MWEAQNHIHVPISTVSINGNSSFVQEKNNLPQNMVKLDSMQG
jgi:hypothetical protein